MSWSVAPIRLEQGDNPAEVIDAATLELRSTLDVDAALQVQAVAAALVELLASGQLGQAPHSVSMWGHSNPGHVDQPGWAADSVGITISRLSAVRPDHVATCASCGKGLNPGDLLCCSSPRTVTSESRS